MSGYSGREGIDDWKGEEFDMIKNERIRIYPASQEQMEKCIDSETDEELNQIPIMQHLREFWRSADFWQPEQSVRKDRVL